MSQEIRILVVDDEYPAIVLRDVAQTYGVHIDIARTRKEAVDLAEEGPAPDLILMDGYLFEKGFNKAYDTLILTRGLRRRGYQGPMIAISSDDDLQVKLLEAGCNEAWSKSDIVPNLKQWIRKCAAL